MQKIICDIMSASESEGCSQTYDERRMSIVLAAAAAESACAANHDIMSASESEGCSQTYDERRIGSR